MDAALVDLLDQLVSVRIQDAVAQLALASVRITSQPVDADQPPGASRIGGLPDLPPDIPWPRRKVSGAPLAFLAQINLGEAAPHDVDGLLPKQGVLYFFADLEALYNSGPADADGWRVIYTEAFPASGPTPAPDDLDEAALFSPSAVRFATEWTLPPYESPMMERLQLTQAEADQYHPPGPDGIKHRLLGHPQQIQGFVPYEITMAVHGLWGTNSWNSPAGRAARAEYNDWRLLFQLDSDQEMNRMMWGDVGRLYFYIRKEDLSNRRFDRVWLTMQCC